MILKSILLPSLMMLSIIYEVASLPTESEKDNTTQSTSGVDTVYDGCGTTKGCLGVPGGTTCINYRNCTMMTTYRPIMNGTFYDMEIYGCMVPPDSYIAVGISTDNKMGDDSVIKCVNYKGALNAYNAVNIKGGSVRFPSLHGFKLKSASHGRGQLYCRVLQPSMHSIINEKNQTLHFDLVNEKYYLLMVSGPVTGPDQIKYPMENQCISDGLVEKENLLRGEEDETKIEADDKLMSNSSTPENNTPELPPIASLIAN